MTVEEIYNMLSAEFGIPPPHVIYSDRIPHGMYYDSHVVLNPDSDLYVALHEFAHYLFHKMGVSFKTVAEEEMAANEFADKMITRFYEPVRELATAFGITGVALVLLGVAICR